VGSEGISARNVRGLKMPALALVIIRWWFVLVDEVCMGDEGLFESVGVDMQVGIGEVEE